MNNKQIDKRDIEKRTMNSRAITVTVLTKNSERTLSQCLDSLSGFAEVVVIDTGSVDGTLSLARRYRNVKVVEREFCGFGPMKNFAAQATQNDWILTIDSDEVLTPELAAEILDLPLDSQKVYSLARTNCYRGRPLPCCGWANDSVKRLFHKGVTRYNDKMVHEDIMVGPGLKLQPLKNPLLHYSFHNVADLIDKMQSYSSLFAESTDRRAIGPWQITARAGLTFVRSYFLQKGVFYGYAGFVVSVCNALGVFFKYIKLYEIRKDRLGGAE